MRFIIGVQRIRVVAALCHRLLRHFALKGLSHSKNCLHRSPFGTAPSTRDALILIRGGVRVLLWGPEKGRGEVGA